VLAQVDEGRNARTNAALGVALDAWLRTHEAEESTLEGYRGYIRRTIRPALGEVPIGKVSPQLLEEFYADLRRCRARCRDVSQPSTTGRLLSMSATRAATVARPAVRARRHVAGRHAAQPLQPDCLRAGLHLFVDRRLRAGGLGMATGANHPRCP
jgi:hypothetical protein